MAYTPNHLKQIKTTIKQYLVEGLNHHQIATKLNELAITTSKGTPFTHMNVGWFTRTYRFYFRGLVRKSSKRTARVKTDAVTKPVRVKTSNDELIQTFLASDLSKKQKLQVIQILLGE